MAQIHKLFDALLSAGGSDLHISPSYPPMYRLKGDLVPIPGAPRLPEPTVRELLIEILDPDQARAIDEEWDLDFAYAYGDKARFRGNYMQKSTGMGGVFRIIPTKILTLEQLNSPEAVRRLSESRQGLILVTGPTGSGKSTTLAAMLDSINKTRYGHILTVEDPVEFVHQPQRCQVTHKEVGRDTPSFTEAMRSAGRENADVVLVGELRGPETMRLALQMASSGVLVFATVHTNSAAATIDRFVNAFPNAEQTAVRGMLAECLTGIVAQQLLKRSGGRGRIAVQEILISSRAVGSTIREGKTRMIPSLIQSGVGEGMQTMDSALDALVQAGEVDPVEAWEKASDKEAFAKLPHVAKVLATMA
jgi:twitching motility protein PilT